MRAHVSRMTAAIIGCLIVALAAPLCRADDLTTNFVLSTSNQAMLGSDQSYALFAGDANSLSASFSFGSISSPGSLCLGSACINTGSYGFQVGAYFDAGVGADLSATVGGGFVSAAVPLGVELGFPHQVATGTPFTVTSAGLFQPGASLTSTAPSTALNMNLTASASYLVSAEGCFGPCASAKAQGIAAASAPILQDAAVISSAGSLGPFNPSLETTPFSGLSVNSSQIANQTLTLNASAAGSVLAAQGDLAQPLSNALGFPVTGTLVAGPASMSYTLLDVTGDLSLMAGQNLSLSATPEVAYELQGVGAAPFTATTPEMGINDPLPLAIPTGDTAIDVTPYYSMNATLSDSATLQASLSAQLTALGLSFSIGGTTISIPPLVNENWQPDIAPVNLISSTQGLGGWDTYTGTSFQINAQTPTPEPATWLLFASGMLLLCGLGWRRLAAARL